MRRLVLAVLYTGLLLAANGAAAELPLEGDMRKFVPAEAPVAAPDVAFADEAGAERRLAEWRGRWVVLNFWATWCAPCREEMPSLERLAGLREDVAVVTVATGPNPLPAIRRFFAETGVESLPVLLDGRSQLAREMGVLGLPVTVILDPEGNEVGRLTGGAEWDGPEALAFLDALAAP